MSKVEQFDRHKIAFCTNKTTTKELLDDNLQYMGMVCNLIANSFIFSMTFIPNTLPMQ